MTKKIALVTNSFNGGLWTSTLFLSDVINQQYDYEAEIVFLANSFQDPLSLRLLKPATWLEGAKIGRSVLRDRHCIHAGATFAEFEFQRYLPRRNLTSLLNSYDLVQVIGGGPAIAYVTKNVSKPVILQVQTQVKVERRKLLHSSKGLNKFRHWIMSNLISRIEERAIHIPEVVFVNNNWMFKWVCSKIGEDRTVFAPPSIDQSYFDREPDVNLKNKGFILSVGRLSDPRKNVRLLFEGYSLLCNMMSDAPELVLTGRTPPNVKDLQYARELGILESIVIHEEVSLKELQDIYRSAILFVLSSDEEGFGLVILEAMASALPVVSTDSGGPDILVDDEVTGYITPLGDASALADSMRKILLDKDLGRKMGLAGYQRAKKKFSPVVIGTKYLRIYEKYL